MKEIIISNLDQYVSSPLAINGQKKDMWERVPYTAGDISGNMLVAGENSFPEPISLNLGVKGWYRIYLCLGYICLGGSPTNAGVEVSLSGGGGKSFIFPTNLEMVDGNRRWALYERGEELPYKVADLTGQSLIFNKPRVFYSTPLSSVILYVKLVEMSDKEVEDYKNSGTKKTIQYHFDNDFCYDCDYTCPEDYLGRLNMLEHGNGESLILEACFDKLNKELSKNIVPYSLMDNKFKNGNLGYYDYCDYFDYSDKIKKLYASRAKELGMNIFSGYRMAIGDFATPYHQNYSSGIQNEAPECRFTLRNGTKLPFLSYAYKKAREIMIKRILDTTPSEFDGVSLFFHRLPSLCGFEQPVLEEVKKLYNVDARVLPIADERYNSVSRAFGTRFIRELKAALEERAEKENHAPYKINAVVLQTVTNSKQFGLDIEEWAKEGLVDSISQGTMQYYEAIDDCLKSDGTIDLNKYEEKRKVTSVMCRSFDDAMEIAGKEIPLFVSIGKKYGIDFYGTLPWEDKNDARFVYTAKRLYELGAEKIICWNADHVTKRLSELATTKECGDRELTLSGKNKIHRKVVKITSLFGNDISVVDTNWQG